MSSTGLDKVYTLDTIKDVADFYDGWATGYEDELAENGYATPARCARAMADHCIDRSAPIAEFGCGTGLGGLALKALGFTCIDGFDRSSEMLDRARPKGGYRALAPIDLSQPLDIAPGTYINAAAIGVLNPNYLPPSVIDEIVGILPSGGCFVFSINDHAIADGSLETRVLELTEYNVCDLLFKEHGAHLPGVDLASTVYILKKR